VQLRPLTRLRLAFFALGTVLLVPFAFLLDAVEHRVETQRRLRHQVVADRIFDELERELTAVLDGESARPSAAYDEATRSDTWAPFVLGYFKLNLSPGTGAPTLLGRDQLDPTRVGRLNGALAIFVAAREHAPAPSITAPRVIAPATPAAPLGDEKVTNTSTPDVLQKLNRGQEARSINSLPAKDYRAKKRDPLQGY
jgi:hypothetical protein